MIQSKSISFTVKNLIELQNKSTKLINEKNQHSINSNNMASNVIQFLFKFIWKTLFDMKRFHIFSVQFICTTWKSCNSAVLPKWAYRVDSCPDPKDINQWINASKALNCHHDLMSKDPKEQELVYHCLPSIYLNETVEFCGRSVPIAPGDFCTILQLVYMMF